MIHCNEIMNGMWKQKATEDAVASIQNLYT